LGATVGLLLLGGEGGGAAEAFAFVTVSLHFSIIIF